MENQSFKHDYYYDGDEGVEMECQKQQQSKAEMHLDRKKEAYDRYMDMLLKRAYEACRKQNDSETETTEDDA